MCATSAGLNCGVIHYYPNPDHCDCHRKCSKCGKVKAPYTYPYVYPNTYYPQYPWYYQSATVGSASAVGGNQYASSNYNYYHDAGTSSN